MQLTKSIQILRAMNFHLFVGFGFYFTIFNAAIAETVVIGWVKAKLDADEAGTVNRLEKSTPKIVSGTPW